MRLGEEETSVEEREMRRDEHLLGADPSPVGHDGAAAVCLLDVARPRALEHVASVTGERGREWKQVLPRVKLRLPVDSDGAEDRKRQVRLGRKVRLDARTPGRGDLFSDRVDLIGRFGVDEVARPLEVAVDAQLFDELRDAFDRCPIRGGVGWGAVLAERVEEAAIDETVTDRQLRRGVSGDSAGDPLTLDERNRLPLA